MKDFTVELHIARKAAGEAAKVIKSQFGRPQDVSIKGDSNTLVTSTDKAAETAILDVLREESPYRILSEESGLTGAGNGPVWVVDPLDGTSNFARSLPLFAVSIALVEGSDILVGVIVDPIHDREYFASRGGGAFINGRPLTTAEMVHPVPMLFLNHGSGPEDVKKFAVITRHLTSGFRIRKLGTTALELCYVATGLYDGFICSGDELWDFAAGALIASEAGCIFTDWKGRKWDGAGNFILITRTAIHAQLLSVTFDLQ
ncbi:MAG: inositol monophosphatase family protein [Mariniphaga sp.]